MKKRVDQLEVGDLVDLFGDEFADPRRDPALGFEFELAPVYAIDRESDECICVYFDHDGVGFPPDHEVEVYAQRKKGVVS